MSNRYSIANIIGIIDVTGSVEVFNSFLFSLLIVIENSLSSSVNESARTCGISIITLKETISFKINYRHNDNKNEKQLENNPTEYIADFF